MSQQPDQFGRSMKEWSLLILWIALGIVFVVFALSMIIAIQNTPSITIKGEIDLGQFTGIIIGIAIVAVTLVAQQLTARQTTAAIKQADDAWLKSEGSISASTSGDWARENDQKHYQGHIDFLQKELDNSKAELADWTTRVNSFPDTMKPMGEMFLNGIRKEIKQTEHDLKNAKDYLERLKKRPTWND